MKILFVDDEPEFQMSHVDVLADLGHQVVLKTDARAALDILQKTEFDLIILDLLLPPFGNHATPLQTRSHYPLHGIDLHIEIREELGLTSVPIVFMSVVRDMSVIAELRERERSYGQRFHMVVKPVLFSELVREIQRASEEVST